MRLEAELADKRRKEERQHELQMQQMFFNCLQTLTHALSHPPHSYYGQASQNTHTPPPSTPIHTPTPPSTPHTYNYSTPPPSTPIHSATPPPPTPHT